MKWLLLLLSASLTIAATPVAGHDPGLSTLRATLAEDRLEIEIELTEAEWRDAQGADALSVLVDGVEVVGRSDVERAPGHVHLTLRYRLPAGRSLRIESLLFDRLPFGHKHHARVVDSRGSDLARGILGAERPALSVDLP